MKLQAIAKILWRQSASAMATIVALLDVLVRVWSEECCARMEEHVIYRIR